MAKKAGFPKAAEAEAQALVTRYRAAASANIDIPPASTRKAREQLHGIATWWLSLPEEFRVWYDDEFSGGMNTVRKFVALVEGMLRHPGGRPASVLEREFRDQIEKIAQVHKITATNEFGRKYLDLAFDKTLSADDYARQRRKDRNRRSWTPPDAKSSGAAPRR
jgi:hypothetical protein